MLSFCSAILKGLLAYDCHEFGTEKKRHAQKRLTSYTVLFAVTQSGYPATSKVGRPGARATSMTMEIILVFVNERRDG